MEAEGKKDLSDWILNHPKKAIQEELLDTVWLMEDSVKREDRENKPRLEIIRLSVLGNAMILVLGLQFRSLPSFILTKF